MSQCPSRSPEAVADAATELGELGETIGVAGDVSAAGDAERAVGELLSRWRRVDVLVQCAALGGNAPLDQLDPDVVDQQLAVNVKGVLLCAKAVASPMRQQGRGRIINVASIMGHLSLPLYGASKAAVSHATRALATELGSDGITVNCVSPANTPTALRKVGEAPGSPTVPPGSSGGSAEKIPLRRRGELDDYVGPILFFASDLARYITGADVLADGGLGLLRA